MKILTDPRSGSYQGITSSRNRFGQYVRTRAIPVQPRTPSQGNVRGRLAVYATRWRGLTTAQRAGWEGMARNYRVTDSLGQSNPLNGFGFFVSANLASQQYAGVPYGDFPPDTLAAFTLDPGSLTATLDISAQTLVIAFDPSPLTANQYLAIETTGPVSPGVGTPPGGQYWRFLAAAEPAATTPFAATTQYLARYPAIAAGQNIFFRMAEFDLLSGRRAAWLTIQGSVVA